MENKQTVKTDRNDRAVQLFLNGQFKQMRDKLAESSRVKKLGTKHVAMNESVVSSYNNRSGSLIKNKNPQNMRRLSHIVDQE